MGKNKFHGKKRRFEGVKFGQHGNNENRGNKERQERTG